MLTVNILKQRTKAGKAVARTRGQAGTGWDLFSGTRLGAENWRSAVGPCVPSVRERMVKRFFEHTIPAAHWARLITGPFPGAGCDDDPLDTCEMVHLYLNEARRSFPSTV